MVPFDSTWTAFRGNERGNRAGGAQRQTDRQTAESVWGDVDWIGLAQDRDRWRALVNVVMNLRAP
jgi:hypothetical protein